MRNFQFFIVNFPLIIVGMRNFQFFIVNFPLIG